MIEAAVSLAVGIISITVWYFTHRAKTRNERIDSTVEQERLKREESINTWWNRN